MGGGGRGSWGARERRDERVMVRIDDTYVGAHAPPPSVDSANGAALAERERECNLMQTGFFEFSVSLQFINLSLHLFFFQFALFSSRTTKSMDDVSAGFGVGRSPPPEGKA